MLGNVKPVGLLFTGDIQVLFSQQAYSVNRSAKLTGVLRKRVFEAQTLCTQIRSFALYFPPCNNKLHFYVR